jgi:hypothetical protein
VMPSPRKRPHIKRKKIKTGQASRNVSQSSTCQKDGMHQC